MDQDKLFKEKKFFLECFLFLFLSKIMRQSRILITILLLLLLAVVVVTTARNPQHPPHRCCNQKTSAAPIPPTSAREICFTCNNITGIYCPTLLHHSMC
jgi:hypothetical protein